MKHAKLGGSGGMPPQLKMRPFKTESDGNFDSNFAIINIFSCYNIIPSNVFQKL